MNQQFVRAARKHIMTGISGRSLNNPPPAVPSRLPIQCRNNYTTSIGTRHPHRSAFTPAYNLPQNTSFHHRQYFTTFTKSEYIHPLSQIVLEHLQSSHSDWIQRMGLDTGLELKKDGTFVLRFGTSCDDGDGKSGQVDSIWTMYEPAEKRHYLCLSKNKLVGRYLLQDNTKPAWHTDKRSIPERVQDAVDEMVVRVDDNEMDSI